jgi:hypothetical protein
VEKAVFEDVGVAGTYKYAWATLAISGKCQQLSLHYDKGDLVQAI